MAAKKPRKALGRGLSALLQDSETPVKKEQRKGLIPEGSNKASINEIPIEQIEVNPFQPRTHFDKEALEELAESIKAQGIIQPVTVRRLADDSYQLISGERRTQASKLAGLKNIPAYIRTANDQQMLEMALIENIQRENLNAIEIALSYQRLLTECDLKQEQLGDRVGKNRTTVNNYLRLLKLPPDIQHGLKEKKISMGHARAIINIDDIDKQLSVYHKTITDDLSVRKVESLVRNLMSGNADETSTQPKKEVSFEVKNVQNKLSSHFGTKIGLKIDNKNKGEIKIPFLSKDDLNRILDILDVNF